MATHNIYYDIKNQVRDLILVFPNYDVRKLHYQHTMAYILIDIFGYKDYKKYDVGMELKNCEKCKKEYELWFGFDHKHYMTGVHSLKYWMERCIYNLSHYIKPPKHMIVEYTYVPIELYEGGSNFIIDFKIHPCSNILFITLSRYIKSGRIVIYRKRKRVSNHVDIASRSIYDPNIFRLVFRLCMN